MIDQMEENLIKNLGYKMEDLPRFEERDLKIGRILGRGSFCVVKEIQDFRGPENLDDNEIGSIMCSNPEENPKYVIKKIMVSESRDMNIKTIKGMELEAKLLSSLDHPNIIKIRATSKAPFDENSFLIIDRLHYSLVDKIDLWNKKESLSGLMGKILDPRGRKKKGLFMEKVMLAYNLSSAMTYIHKNSVIHRDLKPENIGFDKLGRLKLFDFGLAKELLPEHRIDNDLYKLTGGTGTVRYMAPEVFNRYPYGKSADVFSFAILVWQILTCTLPYEKFSVHTYKDLVVDDGYRLELDLSWPSRISDLIRSCWSPFPNKRPNFEDIKSSLFIFLEQHVCHSVKLLDDVPTRTIQNRKDSVKPSLIAGMA